MTSFMKVINVRRDDFAITVIAVRFAGSIKELESITPFNIPLSMKNIAI